MKRIIVVEDDLSIQDAIRLFLESEGYDVATYINGDSLLKNSLEAPQLIILDKLLPGIDGLDICRHLKKKTETKDIPIIIISASPHIEKAAMTAGADGFLEKPFKMQQLRDMVSQHIRQS